MIGVLPASGLSQRLQGIPKFLLPTYGGELLIQYHVRLLSPHVDEVRVCTRQRWHDLVVDLLPGVQVSLIEPSTMNIAVQAIAGDDNVIGMPDTFFTGSNPYALLAGINEQVGVALWECPPTLRGTVGQVDVLDNRILDVRDKDIGCSYSHMWGALKLDKAAVRSLNPNHPHPGYDLMTLTRQHSYAVTMQTGRYIDVGSPRGLHDMLDWGRKVSTQ